MSWKCHLLWEAHWPLESHLLHIHNWNEEAIIQEDPVCQDKEAGYIVPNTFTNTKQKTWKKANVLFSKATEAPGSYALPLADSDHLGFTQSHVWILFWRSLLSEIWWTGIELASLPFKQTPPLGWLPNLGVWRQLSCSCCSFASYFLFTATLELLSPP